MFNTKIFPTKISYNENLPFTCSSSLTSYTCTTSGSGQAAENGSLKEMFGAGTAAVISPISGFTHKEKAFDLPQVEDAYATKLKKQLTELQANRAEDPFGWRYEVPAIEV